MDRTELALCVDVLGPLELRVEGRSVDVPGSRRRALLALLALEGDRGVGTARLIDALWPEGPPDNAVPALYNHVSRLRGHLGPLADRLTRHAAGYRLHLEPFELDSDAARRLASSDPGSALALWRGPALEEFGSYHALEVESVGLEELRLQLLDELLERRLIHGEHTVVVDAAAAAAASPLRERTALVLVRALAAEGRTAEAMQAAHDFRRRLVEETGLDPTAALGELEQLVAAGTIERPSAVRRIAKPSTPMVGRQHDREEVLRLLGTNATVTLTGTGGVGKTTLALDLAAEVKEAAFVTLAVVDRAERVCQAVASRLGLRTSGEVGPDDVATMLAERELLLVLDNCEHVASACRELVVALHRVAPGVRVLATSRSTLQVPGEYVVRLQPLPVPRDAHDLDALRRQPGVQAFVEHARRRQPGYELAAEDAADLVEVLRRLDGLPLGIELAARQIAVMPLRAVRERLDRALDLATGREGEEDARQRTLRATIDSSYRLLGEDEQRLLRAMAPFPGGLDLSTVEALASGTPGDPVDLLHRLVDASLVVAEASTGRYRVLFIVRAFLRDQLRELGETEVAEGRFLERCLAVSEEIRDHLYGPDEAMVDRRLRAELDNFRAARDLAAAYGRDDLRVGITLALAKVGTWRDIRELWVWQLELAAQAVMADEPLWSAILGAAAEGARLMGDLESAAVLSDEAIAIGSDDSLLLHRAWSARGSVAHFRGDFPAAVTAWIRCSEEGLEGERGAFFASAALASTYGGDLEQARSLLDRSHENATCASNVAIAAYVEGELCAVGSPGEAIPYYLEAIEVASRAGCNFIEGVARVSLASAHTINGDVAEAATEFAYLLESWRRSGHNTQLWTTARNAAELLTEVGSVETAALLLVTADTVPGAATVGRQISRFSTRRFTPVDELVDATLLEQLRVEADRLGTSGVLDRAVAELSELASGA